MFEANKKYKVKAIDAGLSETLKGSPQPWIKFQAETGDSMTYYGNLNGGTPEKKAQAEEITANAFVAAGFVGTDVEDLKKPFAVMFPTTPVVTIKVTPHEYQGKKSLKITGVYGEDKAPKKFMGQAPKMASAFAKARKTVGASAPAKTEAEPF